MARPPRSDPPGSAGAGAADRQPSVEALVSRYGSLIRSVIRRVAKAQARVVAEDVEQVVATNLWRQLEREQTIEHPTSYIYRVAVRETVRAVKRELARPERPEDDLDGRPATREGNPQRALERRELGTAIDRAIAGLAVDRARAVRAHLMGLTVAEMMALYGWPYQKARNLIARGLADLRAELKARGLP